MQLFCAFTQGVEIFKLIREGRKYGFFAVLSGRLLFKLCLQVQRRCSFQNVLVCFVWFLILCMKITKLSHKFKVCVRYGKCFCGLFFPILQTCFMSSELTKRYVNKKRVYYNWIAIKTDTRSLSKRLRSRGNELQCLDPGYVFICFIPEILHLLISINLLML